MFYSSIVFFNLYHAQLMFIGLFVESTYRLNIIIDPKSLQILHTYIT